jgi:hypothetical protein
LARASGGRFRKAITRSFSIRGSISTNFVCQLSRQSECEVLVMIIDNLIWGETAHRGGRGETQPPRNVRGAHQNTLPTQRKENDRQSDVTSNCQAKQECSACD